MKLLFVAVFLLFGAGQIADALDIECVFKINPETQTYECEAKVIITGDIRNIDRIVGWHLPGYLNQLVGGFNLRKQKGFKKFPRGLAKFFKKLKKVVVEETEIDEITPDDLEGLDEVEDIDLSDNAITKLPDDLFRFVPWLKFFRIAGNPIEEFGDSFFDLLGNLESFDISRPSCGNKSTSKEKDSVSSLLKLILKSSSKCNRS